MITLQEAREIASLWHGGQWSELYSFSSSGEIRDKENLLIEIESCITHSRCELEHEDLEGLLQLREYVEK